MLYKHDYHFSMKWSHHTKYKVWVQIILVELNQFMIILLKLNKFLLMYLPISLLFMQRLNYRELLHKMDQTGTVETQENDPCILNLKC